MDTVYLDIETDGLNPTRIWCACVSGDMFYDADALRDRLGNPQRIVMHNGLGFDVPVLERLWGIDFTGHEIVDTLVLSRLYNPSLEGGHSLRAWGERLGFPKGDHEDWTKLSDEMVSYCKQDVEVTEKLYLRLTEELSPFGTDSIILEHEVQKAIVEQQQNGWMLDERKSMHLLSELTERRREIEDEVRQRFIPLPVPGREVVPKVTKTGARAKTGLKAFGDSYRDVGGTFTQVTFPEFNLGSRKQIGTYLQRFGWKPLELTPSGQPKVDETILRQVNIPEAQLIADYLLVQKRIAQVESWVDAVESDGRVHGRVNAIGAITGRMTHNSPNMAQVPAVYSQYGKECREVWRVEEGHSLVGVDAAGLELRMLAHYMGDPEYTEQILTGDIHTHNQEAAGLAKRDQAKTFIYAFLYGAGDATIGAIVGGGAKAGSALKEKFLSSLPALDSLRERVERAVGRGYLRGLDGRRVWVRSSHAGLNTLLQSAGAIVMKRALAIFRQYSEKWGLEYKLLGSIHDEYQLEAPTAYADQVGYLMVECIKAAGLYYKMRCPLDGEYKIGLNWAETH